MIFKKMASWLYTKQGMKTYSHSVILNHLKVTLNKGLNGVKQMLPPYQCDQ